MAVHGGNVEEICRKYSIKEEELYDFSANINPLGISQNVKMKMFEAIDKIERYPDITYFNLKREISRFEGVDSNNIILGNGAAEVIFNVSRGLNPKKALLIAPTFSEYEASLRAINCEIEYYNLDKTFKIGRDYLDRLEDKDIVFICNPNNPTGILTEKDFLEEVLKRAKVLVVDESFLDFLEDRNKYSLVDRVETYKNLIIVKSLTKFFAFPGIRLGYGITSNEGYRDAINRVSVAWNVNTVALYGGIQALKEEEYGKKSRSFLKGEKRFLYEELKKIHSLRVYEGSVNFLFFSVNEELDLREKLIERGILIRSCENYKGLDKSYYRVAVRTRNENIALIEALKNILRRDL